MPDSFAELLRQFRIAASLTQEALADRCGISAAAVAALEQGRRRAPRLSTVADIADALNLAPDDRARLANAASYGRQTAAQPAATAPPESAGPTEPLPADGPGARELRHPAPGRLPTPLTALIGRHAEIAAITQELRSQRLVTLVGPGGVGKTRLALRIAAATLDKFAGGTWWIELGPVSDPDGIVSAVLRAVGGSERPGVQSGSEIQAALPDDPVLLVVDNCEHVLDATASLVGELLASSQVTVLATSREPLAIPGEVGWPVPPLPVPPAGVLTADEIIDVDSIELFADRAARASPGFQITDANASAVARICQRLDGIPLAIELVAPKVGVLPVDALADELDKQVALAGATARGVPGRQSTLRASIDWSYQLLGSDERSAFRCLACFAGSFTVTAFQAVVRRVLPGEARAASLDVLASLARKSLVAAGQDGRFRLIETVREYACDMAGQAAELAAIRDAHAEYYEAWLAGLNAAEATDQVLDRIESEYANVRTALIWSIEQSSPRAAGLVAAMGLAWLLLGMFHDAVALGDAALAVVAGSDPLAWSRAAGSLAMARLLAGDTTFTRNVLPEAGAVAQAAGDDLTRGWCCLAQGSWPPFRAERLATACELGTRSSPSLAALAAVSIAASGTESDARYWQQAASLSGQLENSSLRANYDAALAERLIECGQLEAALERARAAAVNTRVMPVVRLMAVGRMLHVALQRRDPQLGLAAEALQDELAHGLADLGPWQSGLRGPRLRLLQGRPPPRPPRQTTGPEFRMTLTPGLVRSFCRIAIDAGERLDPLAFARGAEPPAGGSLMAASIDAVRGAQATALDGDDQAAALHWAASLAAAAPGGYLLLVCDALEALGCMQARRGALGTAAQLLAAAQRCRDEITYRFRFGFEQAAVDAAAAVIGADSPSWPVLGWQEAADLALRLAAG